MLQAQMLSKSNRDGIEGITLSVKGLPFLNDFMPLKHRLCALESKLGRYVDER